jgi:hypothetical protein
MEVLMLHGLTPEQIGIDEDALAKLIGLSKRQAKYFKYVDTEVIAKGLIEQLGLEKARELIERLGNPPSSEESPPSDK